MSHLFQNFFLNQKFYVLDIDKIYHRQKKFQKHLVLVLVLCLNQNRKENEQQFVLVLIF